MSGNGRGGNNRNRQRHSRRRDDSRNPKQDSGRPVNKKNGEPFPDVRAEKDRPNQNKRPLWTAPRVPSSPLPAPDCLWCGKPIKDISTAISDKSSGSPVHFDCVIERISKTEVIENNDVVCYIGGGRFGIVHYNNPPDNMGFKIKKIFEWESVENRNEWRQNISDQFSVT